MELTIFIVILLVILLTLGFFKDRSNNLNNEIEVLDQPVEEDKPSLEEAIKEAENELKNDIKANVKSYFRTRTNIVRANKAELKAFCGKYGLLISPNMSKDEMVEVLIGYLVD